MYEDALAPFDSPTKMWELQDELIADAEDKLGPRSTGKKI